MKEFQIKKKNCQLVLENGKIFNGIGYGAFGDYLGELCFNTSITGYQEILTDPSYFRQIITFTFPHIGIVGTNSGDYESIKIFATACIANNNISMASNFRSQKNFHDWLKFNDTVCVTGIDTRFLTKLIREKGSQNALIHFPKDKFISPKLLIKKLKRLPSMNNQDLASVVSTKREYQWLRKKISISSLFPFKNKFVAVIDYGIKNNILRLLESKHYHVIVFPASSSIKKILKNNPLGIFLSNGPGDPNATFNKYKTQLNLLKETNIPIFGICLGHQILALLFGAKTEKMHHGHRGANHPIKNLKSNKVEITVQNHGFVVSKNKLPKNIDVSHQSLFDKTVAGIKIRRKPFFSVQYHPEASPGPQDSGYLFCQFKQLIKEYAKKKRY